MGVKDDGGPPSYSTANVDTYGMDAKAPSSTEKGGRALDAGGVLPISYHIYKTKALGVSLNVTGDDKDDVKFFLEFPIKFSGGWHLTLHRGDNKNGPVVSVLHRNGALGTDIELTLADGFTTTLSRKNYFSTNIHFRAPKQGSVYQWTKEKGLLSKDYTCRDTENNDVIATWRESGWAMKKLGQVLISKNFAHEADLILTTCIALEETIQEQGTSTAVLASA